MSVCRHRSCCSCSPIGWSPNLVPADVRRWQVQCHVPIWSSSWLSGISSLLSWSSQSLPNQCIYCILSPHCIYPCSGQSWISIICLSLIYLYLSARSWPSLFMLIHSCRRVAPHSIVSLFSLPSVLGPCWIAVTSHDFLNPPSRST